MIVNPHLDGASFFWQGGSTGILVSHGFTATTAEVRPLAHILYEGGYSIAGPLLPGHMTTPDDMNRCRWQDWSAAMETAYQRIAARCERVFVGGESMGGLLALYLAIQHAEVAGILAFAPAIRIRLRRQIAAWLLAPFGAHLKPRAGPQTIVDDRWQGYEVRPARAALQLHRLMRVVNSHLADIRQPILVVQGRLDTTIDPYGADVLYRRIGSRIKELHWMDKSTHCVILDQELPQVARLTLAFIARVNGMP